MDTDAVTNLIGCSPTTSISRATRKTSVLRRSPSPNDIAAHLPSAKSGRAAAVVVRCGYIVLIR